MLSGELLFAACMLLAVAILAAVALQAWHAWLNLKNKELEMRSATRRHNGASRDGIGDGIARIEIADLKERIRKLEAIASGVDL